MEAKNEEEEMHSRCVTGKTPVQKEWYSVAAWSRECHSRAYFFADVSLNRPVDYERLIQRPSLQQLGYLPMFLHPLLECYVPRICSPSHLDQVIGKNNQHPVPVTIPVETTISFV